MFGTYLPPPTTLSGSVHVPVASRSMRVPEEVVTDAVIEELKTRVCFVSQALDTEARSGAISPTEDMAVDSEPPPSDPAMSESEFTRVSREELESAVSSQHAASSGFSVVSHAHAPSIDRTRPDEGHLQGLANLYKSHSTATDLRIRVDPPLSQQTGTGSGTLLVPGWIRERAAEVLFEGGDVDESSVAEVILESLLKVRHHIHTVYPPCTQPSRPSYLANVPLSYMSYFRYRLISGSPWHLPSWLLGELQCCLGSYHDCTQN